MLPLLLPALPANNDDKNDVLQFFCIRIATIVNGLTLINMADSSAGNFGKIWPILALLYLHWYCGTLSTILELFKNIQRVDMKQLKFSEYIEAIVQNFCRSFVFIY